MGRITIAGAGLAGSAAAIAALEGGVGVRMFDPGRLPRHKVCGEFLTPEVAGILDSLGMWTAFQECGIARMERVRLVFGSRECRARLPEPAYGLSRYAMDAMVRGEAERRGAQWLVERAPADVAIVAVGRRGEAQKGHRLFGFKAHFTGPVSDAVELFFDGGFYVGVNPVEGGVTNVCGLGPEPDLQRRGFDYDSLVDTPGPLRERLQRMRRSTEWISVGPLIYQSNCAEHTPKQLLAGDSLQFVDPFTGSGMAAALYAGRMAGIWAAEKRPVADYYRHMHDSFSRQFRISGWLRQLLAWRGSRAVAGWAPPAWLFRMTRPRFSGD